MIQKPQRRGAEIFAFQLSEQLKKEGHSVRKVYLYPPVGSNPLPIQDGDSILRANENHFFEMIPGWNPRLLTELESIVRRFQPHVIQANGARSVKYGALLRWKHPRDSWILVYRNIGDPSVWQGRFLKQWIFRQFLIPRMDGIVAVSSHSLNVLRNFYLAPSRCVQIPRGVDCNAMRPKHRRSEVREELSTPIDAKVLISVGSLTREKRLDRLLRMVHRELPKMPELRLWVVGDGPLRNDLQNSIDQLGISGCVCLLGPQEDVASLLNAADLHVLTSDTEGIPGVVLEAAVLGLPSVATRVGGVADCIVNWETGLLVDPYDEEGLGTAVLELLGDPERRHRMGLRAKEWVTENFSLEKVVDRYLLFYETLLRSNARRLQPGQEISLDFSEL